MSRKVREREDVREVPASSPAQEALPSLAGHPAVLAAREKLAEAEQMARAAEERLAEAERGHDHAEASLREARGLWALHELDDAGLDATAADYEQAFKDLEAARRDVQGARRAVELLRTRLAAAEEAAREEIAATLAETRREAVLVQARALAGLRAAARRLYEVERAIVLEGLSLPGNALALGEVLTSENGLRLRHPDHVLPVHPADPVHKVFAAAARRAGFDIPAFDEEVK